MTLQIILFTALALVAVAFVAVPLLRRSTASVVRAEYDLRVYKDQLDEVDRDRERGLLTEQEADNARLEIQRRMLAADSEAQAARTGHPAPGRGLRLGVAAVAAVAVPLGAFALYGVLGAPGLKDQPFVERQAERLGLTPAELAELQDREKALSAEMAENPGSQDGWLRLAGLRQSIGAYRGALTAYGKAVRLGPVDGATWSSIGQSHVMASDGRVTERAQIAFRNALKADRGDPRARYFLGLGAYQDGDPRRAIAIWRDLSADTPPDAPWAGMLRNRLAFVAQESGIIPMQVTPRHPLQSREGGGETPGLAQAPADDAAGTASADDRQAMIDGMVARLENRLADSPDDFDGWMMLGRSRSVLGDRPGAADAYGKAVALQPEDLDARFAYATALLAAAHAAGAERPPEAFFETVEVIRDKAPESSDALYLGGAAAQFRGDIETARTLWSTLLERMPEDSDSYRVLKGQIEMLDARG